MSASPTSNADLRGGVVRSRWWRTNLAHLVRMVQSAGFARVKTARPFELPFTFSNPWRELRGAVRAYV